MADAPVDGQDSGTETGKPARIPVSEPPEVEPEGEAAPTGGDEGDEPAAESEEPEAAGQGDRTRPLPEPASFDDDRTRPLPEPASFDDDEEPEESAADEGEDETRAEDAPDPAAETQVIRPTAPAPSAFDMFTKKTKPAPPAAPVTPPAPAASAAPAPIPVVEAPDLQEEADAEAEAERASAGPAAPDTPVRVPVAEAAEPEPEPEGAEDETVAVPADLLERAAVERDEEAAAEHVRMPLTSEADETTLIPKVPEHVTESTTVMPSIATPHSDMARRPYVAPPTGYGSARQDWGGDEHDGPDAQATRVQPQVPSGAGGSGRGGAGGYQPPEFRSVDAQRSQLPPPQNFKLDRRELDAEADAAGGGPRHLGRRALLVGGGVAVAAAAGLTSAGVIKLPGTAPKVPTVGFAPATNSGASAATQTGTAFLSAWQNGEYEAAANITDDPAAALAALKAYKKELGVVGLVMNPNAANAVGWMTYAVTTQAGSPMGQWQYDGGFAAYSKQIDGYTRWFVKWDPAILYTSLKPGYKLAIKKTPASIKGLVDRNNQLIDPAAHPSLAGVVSTLMGKAVATGATDGQDIIMTDAKGTQLATVVTLTPPIDNGTVATTLDLSVQSAAEAAVTFRANSSIVAIQPSTGHILAIANNTTSQFYDDALLTRVAPGSTFKIITSTALLSKNLVTLNSNAPCPATITIESVVLHNSEGEAGTGNTYEQDFAQSCNNAFSLFYTDSGVTPNLLADTAKNYFGLNQNWDIGLGQSAQYATVPGSLGGAGLAESLVGQDNVVACPLAMCSVAATVATGTFKQPILLPKQAQIGASALPSSVHADLKTLMASVISSGTAASVGFPNNGHFFGKTGTAEVGSGASLYNNSWFVVFDDQHDIAVCALAIDGSYGATTAAPECLTVFKKLKYA